MTITREDMNRVAERLEGTCDSLESVLESELGVDFDEVPVEMLRHLDDQVLDCTACGWWSEASGFDDDQVCLDCQDHSRDD